MAFSYSELDGEQKMKALLRVAESHASQARIALEKLAIDCDNDYAVLGLAGLIQKTKLDSSLDWYNFHDRLMVSVALSTLKGLAFRTKPCSENTFNSVRAAVYSFRKRNKLEHIEIKDYRSLK